MLQVMADNALKPLWMVGLLLTTNMWCVLLIFGVFFFFDGGCSICGKQ